ncbi:hypothetical protein [Halegenticoccus tardaugens]|uniref:hypothetical protein n=1 Tax=Halegenticoccus tardaugens TaxID=2071624 RepID=UPI00100BEAF0|nr:hypothetical protein [Halegenticoccus tardaugens]
MDFALWAYPWDLLDEGVDRVVDRLIDLGVTEVNLATNYHSVQPFLPHNPRRKTFFARASSYFRPGDAYGRLSPVSNEVMDGDDWVARIDERLADTPLALNSWTVGCHNSRLGMRHPDVTLTNPFGDPLVFGLCPSHPDVRAYLLALVRDLTDRFSFERVELETFDYFHGSGFGWHHDKFHAELGMLGEFLFGLCFCDHCRENARVAGVDVGCARESCRETIVDLAEGRLPADVDVAEWFERHPEVRAYAAARTDTLGSLFADLADVVDSAALGYYTGFFGVENAWMQGIDLQEHAEILDYYTVIAYVSSRREAVERLQTAMALAPDASVHAGLLPGHPAVHDEETVYDLVDGVRDAGVDRISFYNYGLLPSRNLDWIGTAIRRTTD